MSATTTIPAAPGWIVRDGDRVLPIVGWSAGEAPYVWDRESGRVEVADPRRVGFSVEFSMLDYKGTTLAETGV